MKRIAYFGGTFDPVHNGHLSVARSLIKLFNLDQFVFLPAFHAPHKPDLQPTSEFHRFTMLCLATENDENISVSTLELEKREKRYTIDTLQELNQMHLDDKIFFVMGADSWTDIRTWRDWENVLLSSNHIVVSRPGYEIKTDHVTDAVRERIVDQFGHTNHPEPRIYFTDAVEYDTSATELRDDLSDGVLDRESDIPAAVAKYIEKYDLYT
jgi:nicotinate-nucleotide adenylyltransferase